MCCDYEMPIEEEQEKTIEKDKKIIQQQSEFRKVEVNPIAA
ncbi:hypothetical protein NMY3_00732 [Candidatus Nitrosocosmicus oleophilus]|jgi:hypothetical protein|uniref:Uncharacterized protein n=1 Tax=Candidatus Nitrosocosmicus oleophilus TaxID=1353260 RepID=A0A654LXH5_9ARCH|nr:hypothetical protein NMY3_00732 [Candidatus Nitrosocosmicus oleophilus]